MPTTKVYLNWNDDSIIWGSNDYTWNDVAVTITIQDLGGGAGWGGIPPKKKIWDEKIADRVPKETERHFLKLVCKVNGIEYSEEKERMIAKDLTIENIQKTFDTVIPKKAKVMIELKKK